MHNNFKILMIIFGPGVELQQLNLILVISATNTVSKRSFSALRRVKT